jgi:hypothetical protein
LGREPDEGTDRGSNHLNSERLLIHPGRSASRNCYRTNTIDESS